MVLVLGGTNDLARKTDPDVVWTALKRIYAQFEKHDAVVVALTVPPHFQERSWGGWMR